MAKSDGGFITLKTLEEKGYSALEYRYFLLQGHYRKNVNFSWEAMDASKTALEKLKTFLEKVKQTGDKKINQKYWEKFLNDLQFDLHTPKALATLWTLVKDKEVSDEEKYCTILEMDKVFSLGLK
jgi:cysteinyl-tRNA synthetase